MANINQMLAIASHKASDRMYRAATRACQACRNVTQIMSFPQRKQIRTDRLRRQDALARWRCSYECQVDVKEKKRRWAGARLIAAEQLYPAPI
jgi:hypothetical protein